MPVFFLDTDLPDNSAWDRSLTHFLYGGDEHYRLCQEVILGIGGVRMLQALGYEHISRFHMNEGHSAFLALELLDQEARKAGRGAINGDDVETVREKCVFTTHTPVPAGHDQFQIDLVRRVIGQRPDFFDLQELFCFEGRLNMTCLALNLSRYVNGVAKKHGEVSRLMFAGYSIDAITNGVHAATWTARPFQELFDRFMQVKLKYEDPWPLSVKYFLCSRMTGQGEQMGLFLLDMFGNELGLRPRSRPRKTRLARRRQKRGVLPTMRLTRPAG